MSFSYIFKHVVATFQQSNQQHRTQLVRLLIALIVTHRRHTDATQTRCLQIAFADTSIPQRLYTGTWFNFSLADGALCIFMCIILWAHIFFDCLKYVTLMMLYDGMMMLSSDDVAEGDARDVLWTCVDILYVTSSACFGRPIAQWYWNWIKARCCRRLFDEMRWWMVHRAAPWWWCFRWDRRK